MTMRRPFAHLNAMPPAERRAWARPWETASAWLTIGATAAVSAAVLARGGAWLIGSLL
jgi:hypothetical protein